MVSWPKFGAKTKLSWPVVPLSRLVAPAMAPVTILESGPATFWLVRMETSTGADHAKPSLTCTRTVSMPVVEPPWSQSPDNWLAATSIVPPWATLTLLNCNWALVAPAPTSVNLYVNGASPSASVTDTGRLEGLKLNHWLGVSCNAPVTVSTDGVLP